MQLTAHEDATFENAVVYLGGQSFLRCIFRRCTIVVTESSTELNGCLFDQCNVRLDLMLLWGDANALNMARGVIGIMERQHREAAAMAAPLLTPNVPLMPPKLNGVARI